METTFVTQEPLPQPPLPPQGVEVIKPAASPFIRFIRIFLLVLIVIGLGLIATQKMWVPKVVEIILGPQQEFVTPASTVVSAHVAAVATPRGYISFTHDSIWDASPSQTSIVAIPSASIHKEFTVYTPMDAKDAGLAIKDIKTGTVCQTRDYLITHLFLSSDEKTVLIYNYSGSNSYVDAVDTNTCKRVAPTSVLAEASQTNGPVTCPDTSLGKAFTTASLYDGFPSELANLVPEIGGWKDVHGLGVSNEGYFLACTYGNGTLVTPSNSIAYQLPPSFTSCLLTGKGMQVVCK